MNERYLGKLDFADPLHEILFSQLCPDIRDPLFHVNRMSSRLVYKYTEEKIRTAIIGKFFKLNDLSVIFSRAMQTVSGTLKKYSRKLLPGILSIWQ
jgi:hypothetical protein